jgi:hypothetical protein
LDDEPGQTPRWQYYDKSDFKDGVNPMCVYPQLVALYTTPPAEPATVQEPDWLDKEKPETDWDHVWLLIKAASYASARGHMSGTTNWGAAMSAHLRDSTPPAQPAPVPDLTHDQWDQWQDKHGLILEREALDHLRSMLYTTPPAQPAPVPLTDDQIRGLTPKPDGVAEGNVRRVEVLPGVMGTEFDEVDAWSMPLVLQIARAIEAAHGITKGQS